MSEFEKFDRSEPMSNGLINHCLESGTAMTIIIGKSELLTGWMPLPLINPHMGDILEKMKQDLGIGWNLVQSGLNGISMVI
ncbi:hypothetical protein MCOR31_011032 [Pyricularia oryzae]|nr:hypothetical protein MCOR31_011032 [Pyricularia oryzae]KAI6397324.1 hypothetical protein MCOR24_009037 [Pyricularia oryzae]